MSPCDTEMYREEFSATWTPSEIEQMEAESKLAVAKAEAEVVKMGNTRRWTRSYFDKMRKNAMEGAKLEAHTKAHDRHFLRQMREAREAVHVHAE